MLFHLPVKTEIKVISTEQEERAKLFIHKEDKEIRELARYLEKELPESFVRISKSVILNMEKVKEYRPYMGGMMTAEFPNGEIVYISRKYLKELRNRIKEGLLC